ITSLFTPNQLAIFNTATNTFTTIIPYVEFSSGSVITPNGASIYTVESSAATVTLIDAATNTVVTTIPTGAGLGGFDIITNPEGTRIYASNNISGIVTVIDTATNTVVANILTAPGLGPLSITPDGSTVFVGSFTLDQVILIDTATNSVINSLATGAGPGMTSITPDGTKAFTANYLSDTVSIIDVATETITNTINFPAGAGPYGSALLPDGSTLYIVNFLNDTATIIDVATETITGTIPLTTPGANPFWAAATPDGKTVYIVDDTNDIVTPLDATTNTLGSAFGGTGGTFQDMVISPDPAPLAIFTATVLPLGVTTSFDASSSISPIGTIASYTWDFGDGQTATTTSPFIDHFYTMPGVYQVTLTVTNSAGTSTTKVFSSRFMSNNGGEEAIVNQHITIAPLPPTHLIGCQKACKFASQTDIVNALFWLPPSTGGIPLAYEIYRNTSLTKLVARVPGTTLHFFDHNRKKGKVYSYYVVSVVAPNVKSAPVSVFIP
ncbi:MAG TPA: PKD domain-containing protein, partial [Parachlamydiaceae bacterium]|nr:PKD domain-containing protein [Parachlamydiaceae bacterium]